MNIGQAINIAQEQLVHHRQDLVYVVAGNRHQFHATIVRTSAWGDPGTAAVLAQVGDGKDQGLVKDLLRPLIDMEAKELGLIIQQLNRTGKDVGKHTPDGGFFKGAKNLGIPGKPTGYTKEMSMGTTDIDRP